MKAQRYSPESDALLQGAILSAWSRGADTNLIARTFVVSESVAYRIIAAEQDRRYAERSAAPHARASS